MSDFSDWLKNWWRIGKLPYEQGIVRDLVALCARQNDFIAKFHLADGTTFKEAAELVRAAKEFQEKYQ